MTAEEIKEAPAESKTQMGWLREIAYQLALANGRACADAAQPLVAVPVPQVVSKPVEPKAKRK